MVESKWATLTLLGRVCLRLLVQEDQSNGLQKRKDICLWSGGACCPDMTSFLVTLVKLSLIHRL